MHFTHTHTNIRNLKFLEYIMAHHNQIINTKNVFSFLITYGVRKDLLLLLQEIRLRQMQISHVFHSVIRFNDAFS